MRLMSESRLQEDGVCPAEEELNDISLPANLMRNEREESI